MFSKDAIDDDNDDDDDYGDDDDDDGDDDKQSVSINHRSFSFDLLLQLIWVTGLAVWLSGNALASINVVALRQTRLVPGWVTVCGRVNHLGM